MIIIVININKTTTTTTMTMTTPSSSFTTTPKSSLSPPDAQWPREQRTSASGLRFWKCSPSSRSSATWAKWTQKDGFEKWSKFQAFLIAFTSDFIQKLVYKYEYGERGVMRGYVMFTLSKSPVKNWIAKGQVEKMFLFYPEGRNDGDLKVLVQIVKCMRSKQGGPQEKWDWPLVE